MESKEQIKAHFARHLQKLLREQKLSLRGLATSSGLEYSQVQRIANGKVNLALTTIYASAKGLNVPVDKLLTGID
ncbi:helix-turn-helix domain-containing protein [Daejeonella sp.]|uniref:helix-turn-helix domain-containing protein n=1 Tax=Daejeonella sp. TaxID=2805397 RepID=UPI003982DC5A